MTDNETPEPTDTPTFDLPDDVDLSTDQVEDFDAFWSEQDRRGQQVRIGGEVYTLPPAMPLQFELEARKLERSKSDQDVRKVLAILFGEGALDRMAAAGMDIDQFQVLLAWAPQKVVLRDKAPTLAEVAADIAAANVAQAEKPGRPTKRRKS